MPRKTKAPTVADFEALWSALSPADKAECRRRIDKRRSRWEKLDKLMPHYALLYDLYRERLGLRPTTFFKWLGALRGQDGKFLFGQSHYAAWKRLLKRYKANDYEKLARPPWFNDPKLRLVPPPSSLNADDLPLPGIRDTSLTAGEDFREPGFRRHRT
jgi:hypothetical protein